MNLRLLLVLALTPVLAFQSVAQTPGQAVRATMGTTGVNPKLLDLPSLTFPNTGLSILDSDGTHKLTLSTGSNLTANRTLTINTGDSGRTLTLSSSVALNQDLLSSSSPQFANIGVSGAVVAATFEGDGSALTGVPVAVGSISGLGAGVATFLATPSSANLDSAVTGNTGSGALVFGTQPTITFSNTGLTVLDTNASHTLSIVPGSNITSNRTLTFTTDDADRTITLTGNATLNQNVDTLASPTFDHIQASSYTGDHIGDGSALTALNADSVSSGTLAAARGGTGVSNSANLTVSAATTLNRQSSTGLPVEFCIALSDETTAITTGNAKVTFRAPYAFTVTSVRSSLTTASSSGLPTVDINESGSAILSTKISIDVSEKTSTTAVTPPVISDSAIADDAEITFDIDIAGTGATGMKVWILGYR